jgi:hypothetical protein
MRGRRYAVLDEQVKGSTDKPLEVCLTPTTAP